MYGVQVLLLLYKYSVSVQYMQCDEVYSVVCIDTSRLRSVICIEKRAVNYQGNGIICNWYVPALIMLG